MHTLPARSGDATGNPMRSLMSQLSQCTCRSLLRARTKSFWVSVLMSACLFASVCPLEGEKYWDNQDMGTFNGLVSLPAGTSRDTHRWQ
jgi:hypothetical protein